MLADLDAIPQQDGDVVAMATRQLRVVVDIDQGHFKAVEQLCIRGQLGSEFLAQLALSASEENEAGKRRQDPGRGQLGRRASAMAFTVAGGTSPTAVTRKPSTWAV